MRLFYLIFCTLVMATPYAFALTGASSVPSGNSAVGGAPGFAPPVMVLAAGESGLGAVHFAVLTDASLDLTVQQIAAAPSVGFVPFDEAKTYALAQGTALWLHFRVQNDKLGSGDWSVVLSKPFIDRAEFFFQDAQGVWRMQAAGSAVAHQLWPSRGLTPQFRLPETTDAVALTPGHRDYYLRVQKWIPLRFAVHVQRTDQIGEATHRTFLTVGLMLGLLGFMVVFSCVLSVVYRNTAYAWYAAYAAAALMAGASFSGMGAYVFWPAAVTWPVISTMVFVLLGMAAQMGFTRAMFIAPNTPKFWSYLSTTTLVLLLAACAVFLAVDKAAVRVAVFGFGVVGGFAVIGVLVARALRHERKERHERQVASLYLLSFAPMLVVVVLTQIEQLGIAALPWLPYNAPIYGLFFELPLLLVALHLHAKKRHTQAVQSSTLAQTDPLTGFVAPALYTATLQRMWDAAQAKGVDLTVVYVKLVDSAPGARAVYSQSAGRATLRTVRTMRTVAREDDTIARVDDEVFAILMPGVSRSERLASKLARLVALGVMVDADDPLSTPVKFKIVAGSLRSFSGSSVALDAAMKSVLARDEGADYRVIRFIGKRADQPLAIDTSPE